MLVLNLCNGCEKSKKNIITVSEPQKRKFNYAIITDPRHGEKEYAKLVERFPVLWKEALENMYLEFGQPEKLPPSPERR